MQNDSSSSKLRKQIQTSPTFFIYLNIAFILVIPVVVLLLFGLWLDNYFHTLPLFLIIGVLLGFTGSIFNIFKMIKTGK